MRHQPLIATLALLSIFTSSCTGISRTGTPTWSPSPAAPSPAAAPTAAPAAASPAAAAASPAATSAPAVQDEAAITSGIQKALDLYDQAQQSGDPNVLAQAVDQENLPFRRLVQARLERRTGTSYKPQVKRITPLTNGFVRAYIEDLAGAIDLTFRQLSDGRWVLSEPTEDQIGKRETKKTDTFTFISYPWTSDINPTIERIMNEAQAEVKQKLGKLPEKQSTIFIKPIFSLAPLENPNTLAYYDRASRRGQPERIVVFAPYSYAFGHYNPQTGWEGDLKQTLVHEYTHLVNDHAFVPIARLNDWMVEGLAVYISGEDPSYRGVPEAVRANQIIPIIDPAPKNNAEYSDLEHLTILPTANDVSLGYGLAGTLIDFIVTKYGGLDGFWKLAKAQDQEQKFDKALQKAFNTDYVTFDRAWREWLKQKYS